MSWSGRKVVGQHALDLILVELKDIQLPDSMKRAMAKQAEAEREKRPKIINAEGESLAAAALGDASDVMMALQLRNLQSLVEIGVDKNTTLVFPAPLMTTIAELATFLARETAAAAPDLPVANGSPPIGVAANGGNECLSPASQPVHDERALAASLSRQAVVVAHTWTRKDGGCSPCMDGNKLCGRCRSGVACPFGLVAGQWLLIDGLC
jgi:hypothetical protein